MIERLKFATKYSMEKGASELYDAVEKWKSIADVVVLRERILAISRKLLKEHISMVYLFTKEEEAALMKIDCFVSSSAMFGQVSFRALRCLWCSFLQEILTRFTLSFLSPAST